jgi:subtilase family protein/CARDB protein/List-Bact-rpt repeat protein
MVRRLLVASMLPLALVAIVREARALPGALHPRLATLAAGADVSAARAAGLLRFDATGRVQVVVEATGSTDGIAAAVVAADGVVERIARAVVQARVPPAALAALAARPDVRSLRPPDYGLANVGSVTTQGDVVLRADALRAQLGVTGGGVRIGVASNGVAGLAQSIGLGDLPPMTFRCRASDGTLTERASDCETGERLEETVGGVTSRSFSAVPDLAPSGAAEGTAMLEIIHDLAPDAELWFANFETLLEYEAAAAFLAANVDVVVSDITVHGFFPDGRNSVARRFAQIMSAPGTRARAFVQAAGNQAAAHYAGPYTASTFDDGLGRYHLFRAGVDTAGPPTPSPLNRVTVAPGGVLGVFLSWNDAAGASINNYDLLLADCASGRVLDASLGPQTGHQEPNEAVVFVNQDSVSTDVCYLIVNARNAAAVRTLNVTLLGDVIAHEFNTPGRSLMPPADALGDTIAVGAVGADTPAEIEPFSSRGPTFDGRRKPDLVGVDGVIVTGAGGFPSVFLGTSAAASHVAAVAALLLQINPTLTRAQLRSIMASSAVPLGDQNAFGAGRVDASAAGPGAVALRPIPTIVATGLDFGTVTTGAMRQLTMVVRNTGVNRLVGTAAASPPFTLSAGALLNVPSGGAQTIAVRFAPTTPGSVVGNVAVLTNGGDVSRPLTATGALPTFRLTITRTGAGRGDVVSDPATITCGTACAGAFTSGTLVTLTPVAQSGSRFQSWGGACAGAGDCVVTMTAARSVSATFVRLPDLTVAGITAPITASPGRPLGVSVLVHNAGGAAGAFRVGLFMSPDDATPGAGTAMTSWSVAAVAAAGTTRITRVIAVPADWAPGPYWISAIADVDNALVEADHTNNAFTAPGPVMVALPDLATIAVGAPLYGTPGKPVTLTASIRNAAPAAATATNIRVAWYLAATGAVDRGTEIGSARVAALAGGITRAVAATAVIPLVTAPGIYVVSAVADPEGSVRDADVTNNALAATRPISVVTADLVVSAVGAPATVIAGRAMVVTTTVLNQAPALATAPASAVGIYLSPSDVTPGGPRLGARLVPVLGPKGVSSGVTVITVPAALAPGTYFVWAIADDAGAVAEQDETNNARAALLPVVVTAPVVAGGP